MKRLLIIITALLLVLSGCGGSDAAYDTGAVDRMADQGAFSEELEPLDGDVAFPLYALADQGLEREDLTQCAVLRSAGATCEEGAVLVFSAEDQAEKAVTALQDYVQRQIEENRDYRPAEIPKLENAWIDRKGCSVVLIVAENLEAAQGALNTK